MAQLPKPGDTDNNLLWKITENTFEGGGAGGGVGPAGPPGADGVGTIGAAIVGSTPDRVLQTDALGQLQSGVATTTELGFLTGVTSNIQVQIDSFTEGIVGIESLADATAIWLTAAERVGIGTSAPDSLFVVNHNTATLPAVTLVNGFTGGTIDPLIHIGGANSQEGALIIDGYAANGGAIIGRRSQGTAAAPTGIDISGRNLMTFMTSGFDGSVWSAPVNLWTASSDAAWTTTSHPTRLRFFTVASGTTTPPVERMFIGSNGFVGIGTNTPDGKLHVFSASGGTVTPDTFADDFVIENSTFVGMTFVCPNTTVATIAFADPQDSDVGSINYNHSVNVLSTKVGGLEFFYLMGTGRCGIGINSPDGTLHVMTSSIGAATADPNADDLVVENNGPCGISILSINNDQAVLSFGDVDDQDIGQIVYENNGDSMLFICNTFNTMTIVASQRVGIKTNAPDGTLHVLSESAGTVTASATADDLTLENNDHCGISILCPADKVGVIFFGDPGNNSIGQISYNHSVDTMTFTANTVNVAECIGTAFQPGADNTISLGTGARRWTEVFAVAPVINVSDAREKHDIEEIRGEFARYLVDRITPRSYVWNSESQRGTHYGFVAQEIEAVIAARGLVANEFAPLHYDHENDRYGLRAAELVPFLWRVVQDLSARVKALET